jgi:hypothetical protein
VGSGTGSEWLRFLERGNRLHFAGTLPLPRAMVWTTIGSTLGIIVSWQQSRSLTSPKCLSVRARQPGKMPTFGNALQPRLLLAACCLLLLLLLSYFKVDAS